MPTFKCWKNGRPINPLLRQPRDCTEPVRGLVGRWSRAIVTTRKGRSPPKGQHETRCVEGAGSSRRATGRCGRFILDAPRLPRRHRGGGEREAPAHFSSRRTTASSVAMAARVARAASSTVCAASTVLRSQDGTVAMGGLGAAPGGWTAWRGDGLGCGIIPARMNERGAFCSDCGA